ICHTDIERLPCSLKGEDECNDVRFGSKADICAAKSDVRFAPNSDRESRHPQTVMSALPPKADMCSARAHVCFGPKADIDGGICLRACCDSAVAMFDCNVPPTTWPGSRRAGLFC